MDLHLVECKHGESLAGCFSSFFGVIVDLCLADYVITIFILICSAVSFQLGVDEDQGQSLGGNVFAVGEPKRLHEVGRNDLEIVVASLKMV